jgi:DNA-binding response OmpR family regulator
MMRLLLLTEVEQISEELKRVCRNDNILTRFTSPDELLQSRQNQGETRYDCAICDEKFYSSLKSIFQNPIFVLTSIGSSPSWTALLQDGADGVLFEDIPGEGILIQLVSYMRRLGQRSPTKRYLAKFNLLIDLERYRVELSEKVLDLTLTELKVLKELANEEDRVIPRMLIQQEVFGQLAPGNRSLDVHVCSLRKKLRAHGLDVESVRGVGYRLLPYGRTVKLASV